MTETPTPAPAPGTPEPAPKYREYRRLPTLRKGALVRRQNGAIGRITVYDPEHERLEIGPAPRLTLVIRRWLGRWDRREPVFKEPYVSSSVKDIGGVDPLCEPVVVPPVEPMMPVSLDLEGPLAGASQAAWTEHLHEHARILDADLKADGDTKPVSKGWLSAVLCLFGLHDWRNGPGEPCDECGTHDWIFCGCSACTRRRERRGRR